MSKKLILVLVIGFCLFKSHFVYAGVIVINEFVSDPVSGPEWVELLNTSSTEVNLDGWSWTELASPGGETEHESAPKSLSGVISAGSLFVFEMNNALNNSGDSIGLYNGTNLEDRVTFGKVNNFTKNLDVSEKGKSGALISGAWEANQEPTKGQVNPSSDLGGETDNDDSGSSGSSSGGNTTETKTTSKTLQKPKVQIISSNLAYVGIPFIIQGTGTDAEGIKISHGKYFWNFGDGDFREINVINIDKFSHTFFYPGEYTVLLEHYPDSFTDVPDATTEILIKVIEPKVIISRVGDANDFFVELSNETGRNADISNWVLSSDYKIFTFPKNTSIPAGKKIVLSPKISAFTLADKNTLRLLSPERETVFNYISMTTAPTKTLTKKGVPNSLAASSIDKLNPIQAENLLANVISGRDENDSVSSFWVFGVFVIFLGVATGGVYFIRQKRNLTNAEENDFEILDE